MIKRGPIIAGIASVVVIAIFALALVMPRNGEVSAATTELEEAEAKEAALQIQLQELEELARQSPVFVRQLRENEELIPKQADTPGLIRLMKLVATNNGVDLAVLSQSTPTAVEGYSVIALNVNVSGRFDQTAQYLFDLENLSRAIKVINVSIAPGTTGLTTTLAAEVFTTDQSSGPGGTSGSQGSAPAEAPVA